MKIKFENRILGYGINQTNACCRDGSTSSYDYVFDTYEDAEKFLDEMYESGYGNLYCLPGEITLYDEIDASIERHQSMYSEMLSDNECKEIALEVYKQFI